MQRVSTGLDVRAHRLLERLAVMLDILLRGIVCDIVGRDVNVNESMGGISD